MRIRYSLGMLAACLAAAGSFGKRSGKSSLGLQREGAPTLFLSYKSLIRGSAEANPRLKDGDAVLIPEHDEANAAPAPDRGRAPWIAPAPLPLDGAAGP